MLLCTSYFLKNGSFLFDVWTQPQVYLTSVCSHSFVSLSQGNCGFNHSFTEFMSSFHNFQGHTGRHCQNQNNSVSKDQWFISKIDVWNFQPWFSPTELYWHLPLNWNYIIQLCANTRSRPNAEICDKIELTVLCISLCIIIIIINQEKIRKGHMFISSCRCSVR